MSKKVDFLIIGAQKSGTTSLSYYLGQHPKINFSAKKEPQFFSWTQNWQQEVENYHQLFEFAPGCIAGEASTTYTWYPQFNGTAERVHAYNPEMKLIYILRNPVDRVASHYMHRLLKAKIAPSTPIEEEILNNAIYVNRSRYGMQIARYLQFFPREQVEIVILEEFKEHPYRHFRTIWQFLQVEVLAPSEIDFSIQYRSMSRTGDTQLKKLLTPIARLFPLKFRNALRKPFVYNVKEPVELSPELKQVIWTMVSQDVAEVEDLLNRRLVVWRRENRWNG